MAALFLNETGFVASILTYGTNEITGSLFLTLMMIMLIFVLLALVFRISLEIALILIMPLFLVFMAATSEFLAVGGVMLIYLALIVAKNFFLK